MPEVGPDGQARLLNSKVLLVGAGGLGSPAALYLAAAGVGTLGIVDFDVVDVSNLQRQVIHSTDRLGLKKILSAEVAIRALNPDVTVVGHDEALGPANVGRLIAGYDVIVDGTDTFDTRYTLNDAAVMAGIPVVHASVFRFEGQLTTFVPYAGPCYRCLHPTPPPPELAPGCSVTGVLGVVPGVMGLLQATEALKILLGIGESLAGRLHPLRCAGPHLHRAAAAPRPGLPGLLRRGRPGAGSRASAAHPHRPRAGRAHRGARLPVSSPAPGGHRLSQARPVTDVAAAPHPGPERVALPAEIRRALVAHARAEAPNEACGLVAGTAAAGAGGHRDPLDPRPQRGRLAAALRDPPR